MVEPRAGRFVAWGVEGTTVLIVVAAVVAVIHNATALTAAHDALRTAEAMRDVAAATHQYAEAHDALPGDDAAASGRWPVPAPREPGASPGDGVIDGAWWRTDGDLLSENRLFWQHLRLAGHYPGMTAGPAARRPVTGALGRPLGVGGEALDLDNAVCTTMPARLAHEVDAHFDDGRPHSGAWRACAGGPPGPCPRSQGAGWKLAVTYSVCTSLDGA